MVIATIPFHFWPADLHLQDSDLERRLWRQPGEDHLAVVTRLLAASSDCVPRVCLHDKRPQDPARQAQDRPRQPERERC
jgi:hypothetical protein